MEEAERSAGRACLFRTDRVRYILTLVERLRFFARFVPITVAGFYSEKLIGQQTRDSRAQDTPFQWYFRYQSGIHVQVVHRPAAKCRSQWELIWARILARLYYTCIVVVTMTSKHNKKIYRISDILFWIFLLHYWRKMAKCRISSWFLLACVLFVKIRKATKFIFS